MTGPILKRPRRDSEDHALWVVVDQAHHRLLGDGWLAEATRLRSEWDEFMRRRDARQDFDDE